MILSTFAKGGQDELLMAVRGASSPQMKQRTTGPRSFDAPFNASSLKDAAQRTVARAFEKGNSFVPRPKALTQGGADSSVSIEKCLLPSELASFASHLVTEDVPEHNPREPKMGDLVESIFVQHQKIVSANKSLLLTMWKVEDSRKETAKINALLDRCSEVSHALWNKNQEREQGILQLREKLNALQQKENPEVPCEGSVGKRLRPAKMNPAAILRLAQ